MVHAKNTRLMRAWLSVLVAVCSACATQTPQSRFDIQLVGENTVWISAVRSSSDADLRLAGTNPLRSLAEMAGKISLDERVTVMTLLRGSLKRELEQRKVRARFPEEHDARFSVLPLGHEAAARIAREGGLEGALLLNEIRRWDGEAPGLVRLWVEFKLVRIADAGLLWERRVQKVIPANRSGNLAEIHQDAVKEVIGELF
jgi:hypothetical protein